MENRIEDCVMFKNLVDRYATKSDKNNQALIKNIKE